MRDIKKSNGNVHVICRQYISTGDILHKAINVADFTNVNIKILQDGDCNYCRLNCAIVSPFIYTIFLRKKHTRKITYRVDQKLYGTSELSINHIKSYQSLATNLVFFVNLRCRTSTMILSLGIIYSMRKLISDDKYCSRAVFVRYTGWPKKVSHYQVSSSNCTKYRH